MRRWSFKMTLWLAVACALALTSCSGQAPSGPEAKAPTAPPAPRQPEQQAWLAIVQDQSKPLEVRVLNARTIIKVYPSSSEATAARAVLDSLGEPAEPPKWRYSAASDPMSGASYYTASLSSENTLSFGFPYEGSQHGLLQVRRHPERGNDIIFAIQKGQILCNSYRSCPIRVAFDDGKPKTYRGTDAADGSSNYVFLPSFAALTKQMAQAKEMRVQVDVYQQGAPVLVFDVTGFDPAKLQ